jgi:pimeloyl-ACP methyl ester carboxylesterase
MEPHKDDSNLGFADVLEIPVGRDLELGALIGPRGSAVELASDFVVYFPGLGSSKEYFQPCLLSPKLQRFTGLALDSLGIGHSALPRPDDQSYRIQDQATLVNELLDLLVDCIDSFLKEKDALEDIFRTLSCPSYFIRGAQDICPGIDGFTEKIVIPQAGHDVIHEAPSCFNSQLSRILGP